MCCAVPLTASNGAEYLVSADAGVQVAVPVQPLGVDAAPPVFARPQLHVRQGYALKLFDDSALYPGVRSEAVPA